MKIKDLIDILVSLVFMSMCISYVESKVILLQIDPIEITVFIALLWAIIRLAERVVTKIQNLYLQKKMKQKFKNIK